MKGIVFNEQQLEARNSGSKMFLVPITHLNALAALQEYEDGEYRSEEKEFFEEIIRFYAPIQKGDEFFIKKSCNDCNYLHGEYCEAIQDDADTEEGCELHTNILIDVVLDVEVKRVQDLNLLEARLITANTCFGLSDNNWFNNQYEKQGINYDENPYVFLYTIRGIE